MQTSIPAWKRPFNVSLFVEEETKLTDVLFLAGMASSKANAKQMIKNGEVWILKDNLPQTGDIFDCLEKCNNEQSKVRFKFTKNGKLPCDCIFVGSKINVAVCHRIKINPIINVIL